MQMGEDAERGALLAELLEIQAELETSFMPGLVEPVLSLPLTMQQLKVLTVLVTEPGGITTQALAKTVGVSLSTMSGIVDRLETQQMATRALDAHDQRVRRVTASPLGLQTVQKLIATRPELSSTPVAGLAIADLRALTQGVRALLRAVQDDPASRGAEGAV